MAARRGIVLFKPRRHSVVTLVTSSSRCVKIWDFHVFVENFEVNLY